VTETAAGLESVIRDHLAEFRRPGVLSVRPGYQVSNGWLTGRPAIVATVEAKTPDPPAGEALPREIAGVPVDVRQASPRKREVLADPEPGGGALGLTPADGVPPDMPGEITPDGDPAPLARGPAVLTLAASAAKAQLQYSGPPDVKLREATGETSITACASPDAGWPVLKPFLAGVKESLTIGLYDFTSAHVLDWFSEQLAGKTVSLCIDHPPENPTADQTDEDTVHALKTALGDGLTPAWALQRMDPLVAAWIYPSAYHIKVAVRDHEAVWLSSGNWNNSNQPDIDPVNDPGHAEKARTCDRDWHVVIEHPELARLFEAYLLHDRQVAAEHARTDAAPNELAALRELAAALASPPRTPPFVTFHEPLELRQSMRILPLLTPDPGSYCAHIKQLIDSAQHTLYMQFQYVELPPAPSPATAAFSELADAVVARQRAGVDVRIIASQHQTAGYLELMQAAGLDVVHSVKLQNNVHNKGIIADGKTVLVSSQNWSSAGTLNNRDAGVIIRNPRIAAYFQGIFQHDWDHLAHQRTADD
jgi:PLD-like domain